MAGRRALLEQLRDLTREQADDWVEVARRIKQLDRSSPLVGECIGGPYPVVSAAEALAQTLTVLEQGRSQVDGFRTTSAPGGRTAVHVLPHTVWSR